MSPFKKTTIAVCFEVVSPESAENGDAESRGFEVDRRPFEWLDLRTFIRQYGLFHPLKDTGSDWFCSYTDTDYRSGNETSYTLHFENVSDASKARLDRVLSGRKLF